MNSAVMWVSGLLFLTQTGIIHEVRLVVKSPLWTASDKEETSKLLPSPEIYPLPEPQ